MPQRDDQEWEQKRQQIMDGALEVFARKGFESATNKEIAAAAGIGSPGLIYHYFKDKSDLFRQVVEHHAPVLFLVAHVEWIGERPPREVLTTFAAAFVETAQDRRTTALMRLLLGEAVRRPIVADMINHVAPGRIFPALTRYFAAQMDAGVLRQMDPGAAVRCFVGPLLTYLLTREVLPQADTPSLSPDVMAATAVDIFLGGMLVQAEA